MLPGRHKEKASAFRRWLVTRAYSPHPEPPVLRVGAIEKKRLATTEEGILSRQRVEKATQRRAVASDVRRKEGTVLQKFVKSGFAAFIYKSAVLSLELVSDL